MASPLDQYKAYATAKRARDSGVFQNYLANRRRAKSGQEMVRYQDPSHWTDEQKLAMMQKGLDTLQKIEKEVFATERQRMQAKAKVMDGMLRTIGTMKTAQGKTAVQRLKNAMVPELQRVKDILAPGELSESMQGMLGGRAGGGGGLAGGGGGFTPGQQFQMLRDAAKGFQEEEGLNPNFWGSPGALHGGASQIQTGEAPEGSVGSYVAGQASGVGSRGAPMGGGPLAPGELSQGLASIRAAGDVEQAIPLLHSVLPRERPGLVALLDAQKPGMGAAVQAHPDAGGLLEEGNIMAGLDRGRYEHEMGEREQNIARLNRRYGVSSKDAGQIAGKTVNDMEASGIDVSMYRDQGPVRSQAMERQLKYLDQLENLPTDPRVVRERDRIMESPHFQTFMSDLGLNDPEIAFKQYLRVGRQAAREERKQEKEKVKAAIQMGKLPGRPKLGEKRRERRNRRIQAYAMMQQPDGGRRADREEPPAGSPPDAAHQDPGRDDVIRLLGGGGKG